MEGSLDVVKAVTIHFVGLPERASDLAAVERHARPVKDGVHLVQRGFELGQGYNMAPLLSQNNKPALHNKNGSGAAACSVKVPT